ncbi:MAG TPA: pitrilysin family protein [Bacteroidales bacterium]|nr:pitrilysin family protein [Bacteroidales bacterium]HSA43463.1 pitrilysin family protein [Bacteroidales bacterium]
MDATEESSFYCLSNGLRMVHRRVPGLVSHLGVMIAAGTRHEMKQEHGLAHFTEHGIFKGTHKRKAFHINARLEDVGGDLNAYTAREETCIYASFLHPYYGRALELFADILFNPSFPEKEIRKEQSIVVDEINAYRDNPYEMIYEEFESMLFPGHPLGRNILGTRKSVMSFGPDKIRQFVNRLYIPANMVISSVGNIAGRDLWMLAERYFASVPDQAERTFPARQQDFLASSYRTFHKSLKKRAFQTHYICGNLAYSQNDDRRLAFSLLVNLLGGPAMSSRLNMAIRERYGHAYQVEAGYAPFRETGAFMVYIGTDHEYLEPCLDIMHLEFKKLREKKIGPLQFHKAREQFKGQIAIAMDSSLNQMISTGKTYLVYDRVDTAAELIGKIDRITPENLMEVAVEVLDPDRMSSLTYRAR